MGVVTTLEKTLGLSVSRKLEDIRGKVDKGEELEREDLVYLLNQTARFETLTKRVREDSYLITDSYSMDEYELKELVGKVLTELRNVSIMNVEDEQVYRVSLGHIHILGGQRLGIDDIIEEVKGGVTKVRLLQENFDANGDKYKVIGVFDTIKKDYGVTVEITSKDTEEEVLKYVKESIKKVLEKERDELNKTLDRLGV